jgi:hypothetical protein
MRYNVVEDDSKNASLELVTHIPDISDNVGDDAAYKVLISYNFMDLYLVLDDVDNIFYEDFEYGLLNNLNHCGNSYLYRDMAINDDIQDTTIIFTLAKSFDVLPYGFDEYSTIIGVRDMHDYTYYSYVECSDFGYEDCLYHDFCEWEYGTCVDTKEDPVYDCIGEELIYNPACNARLNPNISSMKISYSDNILAVAEGGLGVNIYSYVRYIAESYHDGYNGVWDEGESFTDAGNGDGDWDEGEGFTDANFNDQYDSYCAEDDGAWVSDISTQEDCEAHINGYTWTLEDFVDESNEVWDEGESLEDTIDEAILNGVFDRTGCIGVGECDQDWPLDDVPNEEICDIVFDNGFNVEWIQGDAFEETLEPDGEYTVLKDNLEYRDNFYVQGGSAASLFSTNNFVVAGFDNDRGCYMALLDSDGTIMSNLSFADGYSINAIHYDNGFLALAAGNDGVLLYQWNETLSVNFLTNIDSGDDNYVYDVKVDGNNIYTASENGISIYKIEVE